jgi:hypothetical protein
VNKAATLEWLQNFIASSSFAPHGYCLAWEPVLLADILIGNAMITLAYFIIPIQLLFTLRGVGNKRISVARRPLVVGFFGAFILLCGITHLIDILTIFLPIYWVQAYSLLTTGIVSLIAAGVIQYSLEIDNGDKL